MKKVLTLMAAVMLLASTGMAQTTRRNVGNAQGGYLFAKNVAYKALKAKGAKAVGDTITAFPWEEGFENNGLGWNFVNPNAAAGDQYGFGVVPDDDQHQYSHSGANCLLGAYSDYVNVNQWAISPVITIPANATNYELRYWVYLSEYEGIETHYQVRLSTTGADTGSFSVVLKEETGSTDEYVVRTISLAAYAGQSIRIAFRNITAMGGDAMLVDDIRIGGPETPMLSIQGPATAVQGRSVTFTANTTASSVSWSVDGTAQSTTAATLTTSFSTLGQHYVAASATNTNGTSYDTLRINVIDCAPITTFPWNEGFEGNTDCWSFLTHNDDEVIQIYNNNQYAYDGSKFIYFYSTNATTASDIWAITPALSIPSTGTDFSVKYYNVVASRNGATSRTEVRVSTTNTDTGSFTTVFVDTVLTNNGYALRTVDLGSYAGQTIYIAFVQKTPVGGYAGQLDEVRVGGTPLPELTLAGPTVSRTGDANTYTATADGGTLAWYINDTLQNGQTSATFTHTFAATGTYTVKVSATNVAGSVYDSIVTTVVECSAISQFPYEMDFEEADPCWAMISADPANDGEFGYYTDDAAHGGNGDFRFSSYGRADDYNQYFISPELNIGSNNYDLRFWYKAYNRGDAFRVLVSTTTADTAAFTTVLADITNVPTVWTEAVYSLPANTKYVAINYYGNYQYYLYIDDLYIGSPTVPSVSLEGPSSIKVGNVARYVATSTANTFSWTVDGTAQTETGNVLSTTFTTAGNHTVIVRATNAAGFSEDTLQTNAYSCPAETLPFNATFTDGFGCWDTMSFATSGFGWFLSSEMMDTPIGQILSISAQNSYFGLYDVNVDNWIVSNDITMGNGAYEISWKPYALGAPNYASDHYSVYVISGSDTTMVFSETLGSADTTLDERMAAIPASVSGNFKIAFRHHNSQGGYAVALDDIKVRALTAPSSVRIDGPENVIAGNAVTYTAICGNATSFAWTVDGTAQTETGNVLTFTFTTGGEHTVSVTASNVNGSSDPASLTVNVISCDPVDAPWVEDFEGNTQCWNFLTPDGVSYGFDIFETYTDQQGQPVNYSYSGDHCLFGNYSDDVDVDQWAISPAINIPEDADEYKLAYMITLTSYQGVESHYEVRISTTGSEIADFTDVLLDETDSTGVYVPRVLDISRYAGQTIRIAFRNITPMGGDAMLIDYIQVTDNLGINGVDAESALNVYPNPASTMVSVSAEGIEGNATVQVVDLNGRVMMQQQGNGAQSFRFDVSSLARGAYFVRLTGENASAVRKLIVK
ncbi:MAG: choice-of-anchor J domain-containing protein [Bacteroidales bacterium]|nr:choice-of-anchor J domain-containing protein [Bacteroidales bacterium]